MRFSSGIAVVALSSVLAAVRSARAGEPQAVVWYRASEECPAGAAFLEKVPKRGGGARLAEAGDHIDFLVTLLAGRGETVGRLERQTRSATVAIRELRDANCEQVADALALSLSLALEPNEGQRAADAAPAAPVDASPALPTADDGVPPAPPAAPPVAPPPPPAAVAVGVAPLSAKDVVAVPSPRERRARGSSLSILVDGGILSGVLPDVAARGSLLAVARTPNAILPELALRFGVTGATGAATTVVGEVRRFVVAGRVEACPVAWGTERIAFTPCGAFELGMTGAADSRPTGRQDNALWAAPGAALHGSAAVAGPVSLELTGGALVPLVRSEIAAGTATVYRSEIIAFHAALGVAVRLE